MTTRITALLFIGAISLLVACSSHKPPPDCPNAPPTGSTEFDDCQKLPWPMPPELTKGEFCGDDFKEETENFEAALRFNHRGGDAPDPVEIMLLSGGGSRGSFGAGIWARSWERARDAHSGITDPEKNYLPYDMVTGISTGAIMAPWVYLGTEEAYELMKFAYGGENLTNKDIRSRRWLFPLVDSEFTLDPLRELLRERVMRDELIVKVGAEYQASHRQLWIGSTNLDSGQFCHWNLGRRALEASQATGKAREDAMNLFRELIIASSANPTVFKAVEIEGQTHVDGGVSEMIYVEPLNQLAEYVARERCLHQDNQPRLDIYAVVNGRLNTSQQCSAKGTIALATRALTLLSKSTLRQNLVQIEAVVDRSLMTAAAGLEDQCDLLSDRERLAWNFNTAWIDYRKKLGDAAAFDKAWMRNLYQFGEAWLDQDLWCDGLPTPIREGDKGDPSDRKCLIPIVGLSKCEDGAD